MIVLTIQSKIYKKKKKEKGLLVEGYSLVCLLFSLSL